MLPRAGTEARVPEKSLPVEVRGAAAVTCAVALA